MYGFKIGDKVRIANSLIKKEIGHYGKVTDLDPVRFYPVLVKIKRPEGYHVSGYFKPHDLTIISRDE